MLTPVNIVKEPITELEEMKAYQLRDTMYLYNPITFCESSYSIYESGFMYGVVKCTKDDLIKRLNSIWLNRNAREVSGEEFTSFTDKIAALQTQTHLLKPLSSFEDFVKTIIEVHGLKLK